MKNVVFWNNLGWEGHGTNANKYIAGLLLNFAHLISQFGMIPNGGRCYYVNRSQPPLFIQMVKEYEKASGDTNFVKSIMPLMVEEFNYWQSNHLGQNLLLFFDWLAPILSAKNTAFSSQVVIFEIKSGSWLLIWQLFSFY